MRTAGRCRHCPLRNSIENPCVGADAYIGPVAPIFKSYVGRRALTPPRWRSGYRTAGWGQPALQCLAPLPKGGLGGRIATASVRTDLAMTGFPWSVVHGRRATARVALTEGYKECLAGGRTGASAPTDMWKRLRRAGLQEVWQNGPSGTPAPTEGYKGCVVEGLCPSRGRGRTPPLRRVTRGAVGGPMWASAPTEALVGADDPVRPVPVTQHFVGQGPCALPGVRGKNPPVTALPCQPPLGKGALGTGDADCHSQCAHWLRNDREFYMGCGGRRADRGVHPYGYVETLA